jgi:hypothetical protein
MAHTTAARLLALVGGGSLVLALHAPAQGAVVSSTRITTPSGTATFIDRGGSPTMRVAGHASSGVTQVDVYCMGGPRGSASATPVANGVPVSGGTFSTVAPVPHVGSDSPVCRLRALPHGTNVDTDVSAYAGPLVNIDRLQRLTQDSSTFNFDLTAGSGTGSTEVHSAGNCGDGALGTVPDDQGTPVDFQGCVADLGPSAAAGATGPLRVDGHPALLPYSVLTYADASTTLHLTVRTARSGQVTWTESAPLVRCQGTDVYPPPPGSCDTVVPTGVSFHRHGTFVAGGKQIRLQDSFTSTDGHRHRVRTVYGMAWTPPPTGGLGFAFPGHRRGFHGSTRGEIVTGLPTRSATALVRSDRFAAEGDPMASTRSLTWSRPPTHLSFASGDASVFGMAYSLAVPKNGTVRLGFTDSLGVRTSSAKALGRQAVASVMSTPTIGSPAKGAVVAGKKTVVKGVVHAGVNGLPVSVTVNGHAATLTAVGGSKARYKVVFDEALGKHTLTATATDAGGNKRSTSITVRNK